MRFLLSIAEMRRFFRLENPVANDASRGLDFDFGDGDRTDRCPSTSVVVSVSDLGKLFSEIEVAIDLFGDSFESSTTHCQDPYSCFGMGCPSNVVLPMTILAFSLSVTSTNRLARKPTF